MATDSNTVLKEPITQGAGGKLIIPKEQIVSSTHARSVYATLRTGHLPRIRLYGELSSLAEGRPPYDVQELMQNGLDWCSNVNDMSVKAILDQAALQFWNLLYRSEHLVNFTLVDKSPEAVQISQIMSREWDWTIKTFWPGFITNCAVMMTKMALLGLCPVVWPDEAGPKWDVVDPSKFYVPDQAESDLGKLTTMCIETELPISFLTQVYQEYREKPKSNWNTDAVAELLLLIANNPGPNSSVVDVKEMMAREMNLDIGFDRLYLETVRLVSLFRREYSGKISHYIFHRDYNLENFLYSFSEQYDSFEELMCLFTVNPGEPTIHLNKGVGHRIYSLAQAKMMAVNSVNDLIRWASTPIISSASLISKDIENIRWNLGAPVNIGSAKLEQSTLGAAIEPVIAGANFNESQIKKNVAMSGFDPNYPDPSIGSLSPTQARFQAFREFNVLENQVNHFYVSFDRVIRNMTKRMFKLTSAHRDFTLLKVWKERCVQEGVPEGIFDAKRLNESGLPEAIKDVKATRVAGAGSQVGLILGLQELAPIVSTFSQAEIKEYKKLTVTAALGAEFVPTFVQQDEATEGAEGNTIAGIENAIMQLGKSPVFSGANDHRAHLGTHAALAVGIKQQIDQQQMSFTDADKVFTVLIPHMAEHFNAAENSMFLQDFAKGFARQLRDIDSLAKWVRMQAEKELRQQMQQQQQDQEATQQVMSDSQRKDFVAQKDAERSDFKVKAQAERAEDASQVRAEATRIKTNTDVQIKHQLADADVAVKHKKAGATGGSAPVVENPQEALNDIQGNTPSPFDFEPNPPNGIR